MKWFATVIALVALSGLMVYTNPTKDDFSDYIRQYVIKESRKRTQDTQLQLIAPILGSFAASVMAGQTVRTDYVLFSSYDFHLGDERLKALGLFRNFILLEKPDMKRLMAKPSGGG